MKVTLTDGSVQMISFQKMAFPPGPRQRILSLDAQLHDKFRGLAEPILGADRVATCLERISEIENLPRPHELIGLLDLAG